MYLIYFYYIQFYTQFLSQLAGIWYLRWSSRPNKWQAEIDGVAVCHRLGLRGRREIRNETRTAPGGSVAPNRSEAQRIWNTSVAYHRWIRGNKLNLVC